MRANKLRIVDTILESKTVLIANKDAMKDAAKREKIESINMLLQGAIAAEGRVVLKMNVATDQLQALVEALPDLKRKVPTRHLPSGLVRFAARFDRNLRSIRGDLDKANLCDTSKARNELGFTFRPAREAVSSAALSLRELGVI